MSTEVSSTTQTSSTPQPTAEETEMNKLRLQQFQQTIQPQTNVQLAGLNELQNLFSGQPLSPYFQEASQGISPSAIGAQAYELTRQAMPGFQQLGLADSGVAASEISKTIANQLLFPAEQFNIGAKQNLLNLAFGGQAQVQQPIVAGTSQLGQQLAGLRSYQGYSQSTQTRNPFLENFYGGLGSSLGTGTFGNTKGWFGF